MKRSIKLLLLITTTLASLIIAGCEPEAELVRTFTIPSGDHYSTPRLSESLQSNTLQFYARFDESAVYDFHDAAMQTNVNKLLGFADCNSLHHQNSARFGWRWNNNQLEITAYCYVNSQRVEAFIGTVALNEYNYYEIELTRDAYVFRLNNLEPVFIQRGTTCDTGIYYKLWPYFGGTLAAPHDVHIDIKSIY